MISLLVTLLILCLICAVAWWAIQHLPLPEPFRWVAVVVIAIIAIVLLLQLLPAAGLRFPALR